MAEPAEYGTPANPGRPIGVGTGKGLDTREKWKLFWLAVALAALNLFLAVFTYLGGLLVSAPASALVFFLLYKRYMTNGGLGTGGDRAPPGEPRPA